VLLLSGSLQSYGGAIAEVGDDRTAFSNRERADRVRRRRGLDRPG